MNYPETPTDLQCPLCAHRESKLVHKFSSREAADYYVLHRFDPERNLEMKRHIESLWDSNYCSIYQCQSCTFTYVYPFVGGDVRFYEMLYESPDYPQKKWEFDVTVAALRKLSDNGRPEYPEVLEIGAGDGAFLKMLIPEITSKDRIIATEFSDHCIEVNREEGFVCLKEDLPDLCDGRFMGRFDVISMFQVLEHLDALDKVLDCINHLAKENADLFIAVPNDRRVALNERSGSLKDMAPAHVGRWNEKCFELWGKSRGWRLIDHQREPQSFLHKLYQQSVLTYGQRSRERGTLSGIVGAIRSKPLRYVAILPLLAGFLLHTLSYLPQLSRSDMGPAQWVHLRRGS